MAFPSSIPPDLGYVALLFGLFVVPRMVQRLGIPSAVTALGLGALAGLGFEAFRDDHTVALLSTLGIVSLFLFAGLEVDLAELRSEARVLVEHLVIRLLTLVGATAALVKLLDLDLRPAALVALALLTPSTGFILDSLDRLPLSQRERFWIRSKAIATELVALGVLFVTLRASSAAGLALSSVALASMIVLLPLVFRAFAAVIIPFAPKSEFAFLMIIAVICAVITRRLGVYYLVGAFIVGMAAQRFRERLPSMASEKMLSSVEAFASLFVPFYFFHAGLELKRDDFGFDALLMGGVFLVVAVPARLLLMAVHRRISLKESFRDGLRVGVPMLPTLVFTLVLAGILRTQFQVAGPIFGGLIVYTLANTLLPSLLLRAPPPAYEELEAPPAE